MYSISFVLPFLLVFTIVFAILEKTKIFGATKDGESKKNINAVVALVLGLLMIAQKIFLAFVLNAQGLQNVIFHP